MNVGDDLIQEIIEKRPYSSPKDFLYKVKPSKQAMISLIKSGAFDQMEDRKFVMAWYIWETCDKKKRITLQNMNALIKYELLPYDSDKYAIAQRVYEFNRYLKKVCKFNTTHYKLTDRAIDFLNELEYEKYIKILDNGEFILDINQWDKIYQQYMDIFRNWIAENKDDILSSLNQKIFLEDWNKYAKGNISPWEMETLCFYYHDHELKNVDTLKYGFVDFYKLPENPIVDRTFSKNGKEINIYKLFKISGTCIAKNKTKSTVTLLTTSGVVNVKFRKEYFSLFDKQISIRQPDGSKKIVEKSWFNRGNMIVVMGMRSGDDFIVKKYSSSIGHQLYKIEQINGKDLILRDKRYQGDLENDE